MPDFCAAYGCSNERNNATKQRGITFHRFPNDKRRREAWRAALRRKGFEPKPRTVLCSCHFKPQDFDRTGQTTRLKEGAIPSVFNFLVHLSKLPSTPRCSRTSIKPSVQFSCPERRTRSPIRGQGVVVDSVQDHQYAIDPGNAKHKLAAAQEMVEKLRRDLRNARDRERRQMRTVKSLLEDLNRKKTANRKSAKHAGGVLWSSSGSFEGEACLHPCPEGNLH